VAEAKNSSASNPLNGNPLDERHFVESLIDLSPDILYIYDIVERKNIYINEGIQTVLGYSVAEIKAMGAKLIAVLMHPADFAAYGAVTLPYYVKLNERERFRHQYRMKHRDGEWRWLESTEMIYKREPDGSPRQILGAIRDITEHIQAEMALRESELRFKNIVNASPMGMHLYELVSDDRLIFTGANPAADRIIGVDHAQFIGKTIEVAFPGLIQTDVPSRYREVARQGTLWRTEQIDYDSGNIRGAFEVVAFQTEPGKMVAFFNDISDRKKNQLALERSEARYRMVNELISDYIFEIDVLPDSSIALVTASENYSRITGRKIEEARTLDSWKNIVHPDDFPTVMTLLHGVIIQGKTINHECRSLVREGSLRWINIAAKPMNDSAGGKVTRIIGAIKDITERKLAEQALSDEKERLRVTLQSIGDGVIATDTRGGIVMMNKIAQELTGWTQSEARGRPLVTVFSIVNELTRAPCENPVDKVLGSGEVVELANHTILVSRDGTERIVADSGAPILDKEGHIVGVVLVFRDMTEKQKLIEATLKTQKLESLGILAGGIAHDFNNLLTGIYGFIDLARGETNPSEALQYLDTAVNSMNRARALTQQLLTFAKGGMPVRKIEPLIPFLRDTANFALSGSNVSCSFGIAPDLWHCNYDKNQIGQVVDNIIINAQQAMPMGGSITISAANMVIGDREHGSLPKGNYVCISIRDSGIGISKEILPHIFDPFFTTKQKGSGLGLATSYSIITRHAGTIEVESDPGKGATFHILLPASKDARFTALEKRGKQHKGSGRVLVMDDEDVIMDAVCIMLKILGYDTVGVPNGMGALAAFMKAKDDGHPFKAIILDLTIPGQMGGIETGIEIRKHDHEILIFVASGYAEDPVISNPREFGFTDSLRKPFRVAELAEMLERNMS
jgi:PAS domain S-box-containing protein